MVIALKRGSQMEHQSFIIGSTLQKITAYFFILIFVNKTTIYYNIQNPMNYENGGVVNEEKSL